MALRFAHIVNPYGINGALDPVQLLTISMLERAAKHTAHNVKLLSAQFAEDRSLIPEALEKTNDLTRDLSTVGGNKSLPRLPLLADILSAAQSTDCDYVAWSNMDIIPVPRFYDGVAAILATHACDALIINRRRVAKGLLHNPELLLNETGWPHPGYDCFVMKKELIAQLALGNICVGAPGVGFLLAHNLFAVAKKCEVVSTKHLTLHLGMEIVQPWKGAAVADFQKEEIRKFMKAKRSSFRIEQFPGYDLPFFRRHWKWLMNPLFHYPLLLSLDVKKLFDGRKLRKPAERDSRWQEWKSSRINFDE